MVLECLYRSLSCIALVNVWWHQLKFNILSWRLWTRVLEDSLLSFWLLGCFIMSHMHRRLIILHDFSLLLSGWHFCFISISPCCIYYLWMIWMGIFLSGLNLSSLSIRWRQPLFNFLSWMMVAVSSKRVYWYIYLYYSSSVSYSFIISSLLGYFLMIDNEGGLKFFVDWIFW